VEDGGADAFGLEQAVDRFHQGVVERIADAADGGPDAFQRQMLGESDRGVLPASE
jgi:hypothetical protein